MLTDLQLIAEACTKCGLENTIIENQKIEIELYNDVFLEIINFYNLEDSAIGFKGTPWHGHNTIQFSDKNGLYVELDYYQIIKEICKGTLLVAEERELDNIVDRYLVHQEYFDNLKYLRKGIELKIRKV
jgi:hypothetical protein